VPDEFKVLLSQRRRWINSTIHNLFELVLVRNLCGTFCFSMQFVVMMDLVGTLTLPVAIVLTVVLIINMARTQITDFSTARLFDPDHHSEMGVPDVDGGLFAGAARLELCPPCLLVLAL
jgi:cellulose synthase/poly-beta-1,6-N-acetylglucosamine synthase-like glycosyltransferase